MENAVNSGKATAVTSYILVVGVLIAMSMNSEDKNAFASFHIRQALGLSVTFISLGLIVSNFNSLMILIPLWIFISVLWSYGIFTAISGKTTPIPLLGNLYQKVFKTFS